MNSAASARTSRLIVFLFFLVPLGLFLWLAARQFQADRDIRRARGEKDSLEESAAWMKKSLRTNPADAEAWNDLGNIFQLISRPESVSPAERLAALEQAESSYRRSVEEVPTNGTSHINLGWVRYQIDTLQGRPPGASVKRSFELAVRLDPFNYYPHLLLADYLLYEGKQEQAFQEFRRTIEAYPHDEVIRTVIRKVMGRTTEYALMKQALPEDVALARWYFAGMLLQDLPGRWDESKQEYKKVLNLEPTNTYYRDDYLRSCISLGDVPAAVEEVEERRKVLGDEPDVLLLLAEFLKRQGEFDQALAFCQQASELAPENPRATTLLAEIKTGQGNLLEAVKTYEDHLKRHPKDPEGYFRLGLLYQEHGNKYRAAELIAQAAFLGPGEIRYQSRLADTYRQLGMLDRALEALDRAGKIDPDAIEFLLKSGNIYLQKGDWMEAARMFGQALKKSPNHPEALKGFLNAQSRTP